MAIQSAAGAQLLIGTNAVHSNQSEYEADSYIEVKELKEIGDFGDEFQVIEFTGISDARVRKLKGSANAGSIPVSYAFEDADLGQSAMVSAHANPLSVDYNFKVVYPGGEVRYFSGIVTTLKEGVPDANAVLMISSSVEINTQILKVAAP